MYGWAIGADLERRTVVPAATPAAAPAATPAATPAAAGAATPAAAPAATPAAAPAAAPAATPAAAPAADLPPRLPQRRPPRLPQRRPPRLPQRRPPRLPHRRPAAAAGFDLDTQRAKDEGFEQAFLTVQRLFEHFAQNGETTSEILNRRIDFESWLDDTSVEPTDKAQAFLRPRFETGHWMAMALCSC